MSDPNTEDQYVCTLDDASLKKAMEELHEDPKQRLGAVETFRKWILDQKYLKCLTDTAYLLRFLRAAKFSQLKARETLTGYLSMKREFPQWYDNIDMTEPAIQHFLSCGYLAPLPKRDSEGRAVILLRVGAFDTTGKLYNKHQMFRALFGVLYNLIKDENVQVNGIVYLMDFTGFSMKHQTFWGMQTMKDSIRCWQGNFPARFKGFHYYNIGPVIESIMTLLKPVLSKKFQDRIVIYGSNLENVYKKFPKEMLPTDYLPDDYTGPSAGSHQQLVENLKKKMTSEEILQQILSESQPEHGVDETLKPKASQVPQESFRKLNVD